MTKDICDMVGVKLIVDVDDGDGILLRCKSLTSFASGDDIRLNWIGDELSPTIMSIYILSTPEEDLDTIPPIPYGVPDDATPHAITSGGLSEEVDFELYYDLSVDTSYFKLHIPREFYIV